MTYWSLAVNDLGQDGQPVFNATRRLSDDEYERLSAANELFRRILGQTTWSVVQYNYSCFVLLEQQLRENVAARSTAAPIHADTIQVPIVASIVNFLTAMRMFLDQSELKLKRLDKADCGGQVPNLEDRLFVRVRRLFCLQIPLQIPKTMCCMSAYLVHLEYLSLVRTNQKNWYVLSLSGESP